MAHTPSVNRIELTLCHPEDAEQPISLVFRLRETPIARNYFEALRKANQTGATLYERDRFHHFPGSERDRTWLAAELNRCIDIINAYEPGTIKERAAPQMSQPLMNSLHVYFERLMGGVLTPSRFWTEAPEHVRRALEDFNLHIHAYESIEIAEAGEAAGGGRPGSQIYITFRPLHRTPLADDDYEHFTLQWSFGSWFVNYCEVGKQLWDVFRDKDEVVGDDNIRPLRYYSADAFLWFGEDRDPAWVRKQLEDFSGWWDARRADLEALGFRKDDPRNAIGSIPVADLDRQSGSIAGMSEDEILDLIGKHPWVHDVRARD
ncbi:MAG TPA: hypothetical protein VE093_34265 [Polyangiaceae bacterium]|nr:hypothetical protein [Polyangiaceae bacterium]